MSKQHLSKKEIGFKYEQLALTFLIKHKLVLLEKNYSCKHGEIDLLMQDNNIIVFVEVRYRKTLAFGTPLDTIDKRKQIKLKKTATHYLQKNKLLNNYCRFDAISVDNKNGLKWIKNAFE